MYASSDSRELAVVMAGTSWDGIWMPERHIALQLARRLPVLWVDPPISYLSPLRDPTARQALREERLREVSPNVTRLSPVTVPGVSRPLLREIAARQTRRAVRRAVAELGSPVHCTIVASPADMLDVVPSPRRVLYGTDDFVAGAGLTGTGSSWLQRGTRRQLADADLVVVSSPALREKWLPSRPDIEVVPNGCDAARFAAAELARAPADIELPAPIAGFAGHMSERIDLAMLEAVAATGVSLLLVGPRQPSFEISRLDRLLALPNVQWVGPKPFDQMPAYMGAIDVGLTPYVRSDFNHSSFPLKTLEYLAAGLPTVASDLPAHRWLGTEHVTIVQEPEEFAAAVQVLLRTPRSRSEASARRAFAARHSWESRGTELARLLDLAALHPSPAPIP